MMRHAPPRSSLTRPVYLVPIVCLAIVLTGSLATATESETPQAPRIIGPDQVGAGELLWNSDRGFIPLPVADVEVELNVTGLMIHGRLSQRFHNPTDQVIEAIFVFPMPDRAAVYQMELRIGDRRIVSEIREKKEARRRYEQAKETGRKASLVVQQRANLFTTSVANINPDETIHVVLEFYEEVGYRDGKFSLRFPLTFTPRFDPGQHDAGPAPLDEPLPAGSGFLPLARIGVTLRPGFPLRDVLSDSHELTLSPAGDAVRIETTGPDVIADRDFLLSWRPEPSAEPRSAVFVEERDGERFVLVMVLPPQSEGEVGLGLPTETIFVVDVSGSMAGPSIEQARAALRSALDRLRPDDRFNILTFNDGRRLFRPDSSFPDSDTLAAARNWISGLRAEGGTRIHPALEEALELIEESSRAYAQRIVFVTDGAVANEEQLLRTVSERPEGVRIHTIGIGAAPNAYLMRKMAEFGRGLNCFVADSFRAPDAIATFLERLDRPVMEDLRLNLDEAGLFEVVPSTLPDLYAGIPLMLSGKLSSDQESATLSIGGYTRVGWLDRTVGLDVQAPRGAGIAYRWARLRVESSLDSLHEGADPGMVRDEVVDLALRFNLITRYTSLLAVEDRPTALGTPRTTRLAAALPAGGTDNPLKLWAGCLLTSLGLLFLIAFRREILR
jgi:Ca-activated chloride channel family protein